MYKCYCFLDIYLFGISASRSSIDIHRSQMDIDEGHSILSRVVSSDAISAGRHDGRPRRKKSYPPGSYQPSQPFPPATKSASSGNYHPKFSREYISAGARLRVCGSLSISTRFAAALTRRKIFAGNRYNMRQTICARWYPINPVIKLADAEKRERL